MLKKDCTNYKYESYSRCTAFGRIDSCARDCVRYLTRNLALPPEHPVESLPEPVVATPPPVEENEEKHEEEPERGEKEPEVPAHSGGIQTFKKGRPIGRRP